MKQIDCGFHGEANGSETLVIAGPAIDVIIGFQNKPSYLETHSPSITTQALVDTGAKGNHIDDVIAKTLKLPAIDHRIVAGSNGKHEVDVYLARVEIPALNENIYGEFMGVKLVKGGSRHGAILGRLFLKNVRMEYNGMSGRVTLIKP